MGVTDEILVSKQVREHCQELLLDNATLARVREQLQLDINKGLGKQTNSEATVKCFPTYVQDLPNGKEKGKLLTLDLGGTNFIVIIELGEKHFDMKSKIYAIPESIKLQRYIYT